MRVKKAFAGDDSVPRLRPSNQTMQPAEPRPQHYIGLGIAAAQFILFGRCGVGFGGRSVLFVAAMAASSGRLGPGWVAPDVMAVAAVSTV